MKLKVEHIKLFFGRIINSLKIILSNFDKIFNPLQWDNKMRFHFFVNIIVGIVIAIVLSFVEKGPIGKNAVNLMFDKFITNKDYKGTEEKNIPENLIFVDITENIDSTWRQDNSAESLITNRAMLAKLLSAIEKCSPKVIFLDITFDEKTKFDSALRNYLIQFSERVLNNETQTKLILPISRPKCPNEKLTANIFDSIITKCPNIYLGLPEIASDIDERKIRYINEYYITGKKDTIWSVPIVALALYNGIPRSCFSKKMFEDSLNIEISDVREDSPNRINELTSRIRYHLMPPDKCRNLDGNIDYGNEKKLKIRYDADEFCDTTGNESYLSKQEKESIIKDKVIFIGNTSISKGDIHLTPIGEMSGLFILGNTFNTLQNDQIKELPCFFKYSIEFLVLTICAYLFLYFKTMVAEILSVIFIIYPSICLTIYVFETWGTFINIVFIALGIMLHRLFASLEDDLHPFKIKDFKSNLFRH